MELPKARAVGYSQKSFVKMPEKSWDEKDYFFLFQNIKSVYSGYFITKWLTAMYKERENAIRKHAGPTTTSHTCLSDEHSAT